MEGLMRVAWVLFWVACAPVDADKDGATTDMSDADITDPTSDEAVTDPATDPIEPTDDDESPVVEVEPVDYCEHVVEAYCEFYLRCGRHVAEDAAACRTQFLETCNAVYEPHYVALAAQGLLALSPTGVAACVDHLGAVECALQPQDLDGPCGTMWVGQADAGAACGLGIESMVCDAESTCVLGLNLCGTCQSVVPAGAPCADGDRCPTDHTCTDDPATEDSTTVCLPRGRPGDRCTDERPCELGLSCERRTCVARPVVGLGETCGADAACAYGSACVGGACVVQVSFGDACDAATPCRSGRCGATGTCEPLRAAGVPCAGGWECLSGLCDEVCGELPGVCFLDPV